LSLAPSPLAILICGSSKVAVVFARCDIEKTRDFRRVRVRNLSSAMILLFSFLRNDLLLLLKQRDNSTYHSPAKNLNHVRRVLHARDQLANHSTPVI